MHSRCVFLISAVIALTTVSCSHDRQKLKRQYSESGDRFVAKKDYREAIIQYRNAISQDASFGEARFKLAAAYEAAGDLRNALQEYVRAADLMPDNVDAQLHAGKLLVAAGQYPEAKARAVAALEKDHRRADALHSHVDRLGRACLDRGPLSAQESQLFRQAMADLLSIYKEHIRIEDEGLFPVAGKLLSATDKAAIAGEMAARRG